jgi:signal transduction histidine kinase/ligand-binding sensor domain-containing protein
MPVYPGSGSIKPVKSEVNIRYFLPFCALIFTLIFWLNVAILSAQTHDNLRFERYTIEQGLSSDLIRDITQDHLGYIWVATESGVSRYDGYDFKVYRNIPGDITTLTNNLAYAIHADRYNQLWIGTSSGLNVYDPITDSFERIYHIPDDGSSLPDNLIYEIFESGSGDLWLGTNNGLALYDRTKHSFVSQWLLNGERVDLHGVEVVSIAEDADGSLWIGSKNKGLIFFNPVKQVIRYFDQEPIPNISFPSNNISKVYVDTSGDVWIGFLGTDVQFSILDPNNTGNGLGVLHTKTNTFTIYRNNPQTQPGFWNLISDIHESRDGTMWVSTYYNSFFSGLHLFDRVTETFTRYSYDSNDAASLTWDFVTNVFEDRFNNLWVGTSRGLNKADLGKWQMKKFTVRPDAPELFLDNFYGIEEVSDGIIWFGLDDPGFIEWNRNTGEITHFAGDNPSNHLDDLNIPSGVTPVIKKDLTGEIWIGYAGGGLVRANLETRDVVRYQQDLSNPDAISGNYITGILIDETITAWFSTTDGLSRYNRESDSFTSWTTQNSEIGSNSLSTIFKDSRGVIWLGTREHRYDPRFVPSNGLIRFNPQNESFTSYRHDPNNVRSLSSNTVNSIAEDHNGNIWIATDNGLNRFNHLDESFEQYHVKDGLPDPVVIGLLIDLDGLLWMSTLNGLSRFNPETNDFHNFDKSDGTQGNRFNDYSYLITKDGELIFGGVAGANYFHPSDIFENSTEPVIHLTNFLVNNTSFSLDEQLQNIDLIELGWSDNSVGFEFTAINFRKTELTEYEYKLEGFEDDWMSSGTRRFVNYTNLPSGNYTFHVRAVNAEGILSPISAAMAIRIQPPFWRTWWAYGFYVMLFIVGIVTIDRYQRKRVIKKEREEAREKELQQAKEIEKAYRNLEVAHKNLEAAQDQLVQQEKLASLGQLTAGIAHEIKNPLNFVNNFSEVSEEMITELIEALGKGDIDESLSLSKDIGANLKKIHEHGSRADGIVKSMLMHSRGGSGKMEPTDLNELVKEYVNLTYHGMRAGKEALNADIQMDLDDSVGDVPLVAEDFSRVILNLCNNAFDAMRDTRDLRAPKLSVSTKKSADSITIEIEDNGPGIPDGIKDKILQPFYTTKKGTQGTGLGLSITNDIIKAHGGSMEIQSKPGQTVFSISLNRLG